MPQWAVLFCALFALDFLGYFQRRRIGYSFLALLGYLKLVGYLKRQREDFVLANAEQYIKMRRESREAYLRSLRRTQAPEENHQDSTGS